MIDVAGLELSLDAGLPENASLALREITQQLGIDPANVEDIQLLKRSVDARKKSNVHFIAAYRIALEPKVEDDLLHRFDTNDKKLKGLQIKPAKPYAPLDIPVLCAPAVPPVVVGAGPAGLFAVWYLAKAGLRPVLIEQGAPVEERMEDVQKFFATGKLDPLSNIQFGEGGAGTFSDGKLTTNTKNRYTAHVLQWFVDAGAPESILWQAHPHLGSDNLANIVRAIREDIIALGGTVRFHTRLVNMEFSDNALCSITLQNTIDGSTEMLPCEALVLACGHSARSVFELVRDLGFTMEQKPFSMGVRIEHPQELINKAQWGSAADHPALGAAEYKLAVHLPSGRSVYSFCMCPGGEVVAAASEEGGIVTNGMSNYARNGENANAAILVNVDPSDFESDDVLAGMALQRAVEQRAFELSQAQGASAYQAPAQTLGSFLGLPSKREVEPTYERGVVEASIDEVLPGFVCAALREAFPIMGRKIKGFDLPGAVLTAPETRSSSPVRICRNEQLQAYFSEELSDSKQSGLYPCGEGPGFAGGIMSAAVDGLKVATEVAKRYSSSDVEALLDALRRGEAAVFPTDTVYGLGIAVECACSPDLLYELKKRSEDKPIAWLVGSVEDLQIYGKNVPTWTIDLAKNNWPGALTLIVEASDAVPHTYRAKQNTIALRMPDHETALALIREVGPLATTSANFSGEPAPAALCEVPVDLLKQVPCLSGTTSSGCASTVVDCTQGEPLVVRKGDVQL